MKTIIKYLFFVVLFVSFAYAGKPTITISDNIDANVTNQDITFTFEFSENVNGFTSDDITIANGTKGTFTGDDNSTTFTLLVTPKTDFEGNVTVDVDANVTTSDSTNEGNDAATQAIQTVDTKKPTITSLTIWKRANCKTKP